MDKADLIILANGYDTLYFYDDYRFLKAEEKKFVAEQFESLFMDEVVRYVKSTIKKADDTYDYYIGLCEKRILTIDTFNYAAFMFQIMNDKGILRGRDSVVDMMINASAAKPFGNIGEEIRWLERNTTHPDFKRRRQLAADCVAELRDRMKAHYTARNVDNDRSLARNEKEFLKVSYNVINAYYGSISMALEALESKKSETGKTKADSKSANRNNLGNPFDLLEKLPDMSMIEREDLKQDALANVTADGRELFDMIGKDKSPSIEKCNGYMDNMESLMILNNTPMFDSPVVHVMGVMLLATNSGGEKISNKKIYGTLGDRINRAEKSVNAATKKTTLSDVIIFSGISLALAALCAFLIFNPGVKEFFQKDFFYTASYIICAVIGIGIMFTLGLVAFGVFALVSAFIFGNLQDLIGIGVAVKWLLIIVVGGLAVVCILSTIGLFLEYMESKKLDLSDKIKEAEEQLDICEKYVDKCKAYLSKFASILEEAYKVGLCEKDRYDKMKELLPSVNTYYIRAITRLTNLSEKLEKQ